MDDQNGDEVRAVLGVEVIQIRNVLEVVGVDLAALHDVVRLDVVGELLDVEGDAAQMGKAAHSDEKKHKSTYVTLYTLEGAKALAQKTVDEALGCLEMFGENAEALREITKMMCGRKS